MDIERFGQGSLGSLQRITGFDSFLNRPYDHYAFVPSALPSSIPLSELSYSLTSDAAHAVRRLDEAAERLPNPALLVRPTLYREAVSTSALEGTYAPLFEVLEADYVEERSRSQEVREVLNYVRAATRGLELITEKPICVTLISELQELLVRSTRGGGANVGQLRTSQVYIGERHKGIEQSRFVPPPPGQILVDGMSDWEKWLNAEDHIPVLAKVALGHYYWFETLHPFYDGNGRIGRLIMVLQLIYAGRLRHPILNLSPWLEPRKEAYKDVLLSCSQTGDVNPWIQFFAEGVIAQVDDAIARIERLIEIRNLMLARLRAQRAKGIVLEIVDDLIGYPIITVTQAASLHNVTYPPANAAIQRLESLGMIREITGRSYGRVYACDDVMRAVEDPQP